MRSYFDEKEQELAAVICNHCKKELKVEKGILKEGCFEGKQRFGFFSKKDGQEHSFDLCEECYDSMIESFQMEVNRKEMTELL